MLKFDLTPETEQLKITGSGTKIWFGSVKKISFDPMFPSRDHFISTALNLDQTEVKLWFLVLLSIPLDCEREMIVFFIVYSERQKSKIDGKCKIAVADRSNIPPRQMGARDG